MLSSVTSAVEALARAFGKRIIRRTKTIKRTVNKMRLKTNSIVEMILRPSNLDGISTGILRGYARTRGLPGKGAGA